LEEKMPVNNSIKSKLIKKIYKFRLYTFSLFTDKGIKNDNEGTTFLIETFLNNKNRKFKKMLNLFWDNGFLGITLNKIFNLHIDLISNNKRAVHLALMNKKENNLDIDAIYNEKLEIDEKYDLIILNPDMKMGKEKLITMFKNMKKNLINDGEIWFVIHKDEGAKSFAEILKSEYNLEMIDKRKGFYVFKAKSC
jgi:16S rRNA (guanine1207-N2)-methyltransferase